MMRAAVWCTLALTCAACAQAQEKGTAGDLSAQAGAQATTGVSPATGSGAGGTTGVTGQTGQANDSYVRPSAEGGALVQGDTVPGLPSWTQQDWEVLRHTVTAARQNHLDALPIGERVARLGETFVGSPYLPQTLDPPGPERLVINLRAMDCVTFVENMLALAHFIRETPGDVLDHPQDAMRTYQRMIETIRYRDGHLSGYPSRLHYFTDWLADNERKGLEKVVTKDLGGIVDPEPITFMSTHRASYRQLADDADYQEIGRLEGRVNQAPRYYIPKDRVAAITSKLQDGDILAMTSTLKGLDVAHTGIAVRKNGEIHLLNAPLVGKNVEISEKEISARLAGIKSQDGMMVARPQETPILGSGK